jgi:1-acyl-sn-glycerol-3-phosphate acyltransferase
MNKFFLFAYIVLYIFKTVLYPLKTKGRENIPEGPAMVCANHSSYTDPIMISYAFGLPNILHFMAKIELFRIPLLGRYIKAMGSFGVDRGTNDMNAVRTAMKYIKSGEKVMIFPEGTRVLEEDAAAGKIGAVRIAMRLNVPIVPVYI